MFGAGGGGDGAPLTGDPLLSGGEGDAMLLDAPPTEAEADAAIATIALEPPAAELFARAPSGLAALEAPLSTAPAIPAAGWDAFGEGGAVGDLPDAAAAALPLPLPSSPPEQQLRAPPPPDGLEAGAAAAAGPLVPIEAAGDAQLHGPVGAALLAAATRPRGAGAAASAAAAVAAVVHSMEREQAARAAARRQQQQQQQQQSCAEGDLEAWEGLQSGGGGGGALADEAGGGDDGAAAAAAAAAAAVGEIPDLDALLGSGGGGALVQNASAAGVEEDGHEATAAAAAARQWRGPQPRPPKAPTAAAAAAAGGGGQPLASLRTASGRLVGWPGARAALGRQASLLSQTPPAARGAPGPNGAQPLSPAAGAGAGVNGDLAAALSSRGAVAGSGGDAGGDTEMETEAGFGPRTSLVAASFTSRLGVPPPLLMALAAADGGGDDGACCLCCTAPLWGPVCEGCGHAREDDAALLAGRHPPIDDDGRRGRAAAAASDGAGAPLLAWDPRLLEHALPRARAHPERPERAAAAAARLEATGLAARCRRVPCRPATAEELGAVHDAALLAEIEAGSAALRAADAGAGGDGAGGVPGSNSAAAAAIEHGAEAGLPHVLDCYMTARTAACAALAAGGAAAVAAAVARRAAPGGAAVIRPPGHHAESGVAMGFCLINNAAVAARAAQRAAAEAAEAAGEGGDGAALLPPRVAIVDFDVHHGNGTADIFEADPSVLFVSIHRHDDGNFFPGTGAPTDVGAAGAEGATVNVAWAGPGAGDADYIAAFTRVVLPILYEFGPAVIVVSAGFDAAAGDPLGGCRVTPECYGHMVALLRPVAPLVLLLEGGYNLAATALSMEACVRALLGDAPPPLRAPLAPTAVGLAAIERTLAAQRRFWRCLGPAGFGGALGRGGGGSRLRVRLPTRDGGWPAEAEHDDDDGSPLASPMASPAPAIVAAAAAGGAAGHDGVGGGSGGGGRDEAMDDDGSAAAAALQMGNAAALISTTAAAAAASGADAADAVHHDAVALSSTPFDAFAPPPVSPAIAAAGVGPGIIAAPAAAVPHGGGLIGSPDYPI